MKTVGEFKKAGLAFVKGDTCKEQKGITYVAGGWSDYENEGDDDWINDIVTEFAWRENTGVKPEFQGLVDVKFSTGATLSDYDKNLIGWNKAGEVLSIIEWRPSLNQPQQWPENSRMDIIGQNGNDGLHYDNTAQQVEALAVNNKPIFTQAMVDAGEKVKVGMEFSTARGNYVALLVNENTVVFEHEELGFVVENHFFIHPVDTRTDRERAIDEAMADIDAERDDHANVAGVVERMIAAGYSKC